MQKREKKKKRRDGSRISYKKIIKQELMEEMENYFIIM